jgi:XrtJ-associated TM-motif-TM protein
MTDVPPSPVDNPPARQYLPGWRTIMKKSTLLFAGLALLFTVTLPLHATDGCLNSPENPTAILAVVGSAGAFFVSARARIKARRRSGK